MPKRTHLHAQIYLKYLCLINASKQIFLTIKTLLTKHSKVISEFIVANNFFIRILRLLLALCVLLLMQTAFPLCGSVFLHTYTKTYTYTSTLECIAKQA